MRMLSLSVVFITLAIASCRSRESTTTSPAAKSTTRVENSGAADRPRQLCLNLNTATAQELVKLPGVGDVMAKRIIDYRERHGRLRRAEEIIIIEGFSDRKYRAIAALVCVE
jgi:competence protein ComEA